MEQVDVRLLRVDLLGSFLLYVLGGVLQEVVEAEGEGGGREVREVVGHRRAGGGEGLPGRRHRVGGVGLVVLGLGWLGLVLGLILGLLRGLLLVVAVWFLGVLF